MVSNSRSTYLALGDSYTVGEGVHEKDCWPAMLAARKNWQSPTIIATSGWKTFELIEAIENTSLEKPYDWISLLIGVNNQYRKLPFADFQRDLERLSQLINPLVKSSNHVFFVSIPDYSVTPFAQEHNPKKISAELSQYNHYKEKFATEHGYQFCNITDISLKAKSHSNLLVSDELHPSADQYRIWVDRIEQSCNFSH